MTTHNTSSRKRNPWLVAVGVVCLLLAAAVAGGYWYFREIPDVQRVKWWMSRSEVGMIFDRIRDMTLESGTTGALIYRTTLADVPVGLGCFFEDDELRLMRYASLKKDKTAEQTRDEFLAVKTYFHTHFGGPASDASEEHQQIVTWEIPWWKVELVYDKGLSQWALDIRMPDSVSAEEALRLANQELERRKAAKNGS
jgi:hypothetical protein